MQPHDLQRLEHIIDYCEDIADCLARIDSSRERFNADTMIQYSIAFCILQIGELAGKLSPELRAETSDEIRWNEIRGMRNIVVHDYGEIKLGIVWDVAVHDIPVLKEFCEEKLEQPQRLIHE